MDKKLVIIASGGRTATQFFGDLLGQVIENCWSEHEADMFNGFNSKSLNRIQEYGLWHVVFGRALGRTGLRSAGMRYVAGEVQLSDVAKQLRYERDRIYSRVPHTLIIDSYPRWWMFAGKIDLIWPSAKTVLIIRDPKHWISSWLVHINNTSRVWTKFFPPGPFTPETVGDQYWVKRWSNMSPIGRRAWEWREIYSRLDYAAEHGENCRLFKFEELFDRSTGAMQELVDFSRCHADKTFAQRDFDLLGQEPRNTSSTEQQSWRLWTSEDCQLVNELCGPLMEKYGYELLPSNTLISTKS